jgi:hypothetical protein
MRANLWPRARRTKIASAALADPLVLLLVPEMPIMIMTGAIITTALLLVGADHHADHHHDDQDGGHHDRHVGGIIGSAVAGPARPPWASLSGASASAIRFRRLVDARAGAASGRNAARLSRDETSTSRRPQGFDQQSEPPGEPAPWQSGARHFAANRICL